MVKFVLIILLACVWIWMLSIFKRRDMSFFFFLVGGVGFFLFAFNILEPVLTAPLARLVCWLTGLVGRLTGIFTAYASYGILFIQESKGGPISLYVDFECAGLVEILVYLSLLLFYQAYKWYEKLWIAPVGVL